MPHEWMEQFENDPRWQELMPQEKQEFLESLPEMQALSPVERAMVVLDAVHLKPKKMSLPAPKDITEGKKEFQPQIMSDFGSTGEPLDKKQSFRLLGSMAGSASGLTKGSPVMAAVGGALGTRATTGPEVASILAGDLALGGLNKIPIPSPASNAGQKLMQLFTGGLKGILTNKGSQAGAALAGDEQASSDLGEITTSDKIASLLGGAGGFGAAAAGQKQNRMLDMLAKGQNAQKLQEKGETMANVLQRSRDRLGRFIARSTEKEGQIERQIFNKTKETSALREAAKQQKELSKKQGLVDYDTETERLRRKIAGENKPYLKQTEREVEKLLKDRQIHRRLVSSITGQADEQLEKSEKELNDLLSGQLAQKTGNKVKQAALRARQVKIQGQLEQNKRDVERVLAEMPDPTKASKLLDFLTSPGSAYHLIGAFGGGVPARMAAYAVAAATRSTIKSDGLRKWAAELLSQDKLQNWDAMLPSIYAFPDRDEITAPSNP